MIPPVTTTLTGAIVPPSNPGFLSLSPALTPQPSGYLNTMLQTIQVNIDQENIDVLTGIMKRYRGLLEGDMVGPLQVQSVEQQLLAGRSTSPYRSTERAAGTECLQDRDRRADDAEHSNGRLGAAAAGEAIPSGAGDHRG